MLLAIIYMLFGAWFIADSCEAFNEKKYFKCGLCAMMAFMCAAFMVPQLFEL